MTVTYSWKITGMRKRNDQTLGLSDIVVQVFWEQRGTDGAYTGIFNGATPFRLADVNPHTFIPFENLTEYAVIEWVKYTIDSRPEYKAHIESQISTQIETAKSPMVNVGASAFPWASAH